MPKVRQQFDIHSNVIDKQAELQKKSSVYSTEKINAITKDLVNGNGKPDTTPFFHGSPDWRDAGVIFDYTDEELEILEKCANDCVFFVENYAKFLNKKGRTLVKLYDFQKENLEIMSAEKWDPDEEVVVPVNPDIVLMQSRQTSKTTTISAYIAWYSIFHNDRNVFVCANKGRTATEIIGKIKEVLEGLPYFLKPGIMNMSEGRIKFENGTCIKCAAASKTPATGDSIQLLYIDEAALIPQGVIDEYWASVIPTMSNFPNAQLIVSSTPRGKSGKFYEIVDGAIKHEKTFYYRRVDWWQVPGHDEKWAEKWRKKLGNELFEREFNLSFESDSSRLCSNKSILFMNKIKQDFIHRDFYMVPQEVSDKIYWSPDFDPTYMDYHTLKSKSFLFVIDTAQGIEASTVEKTDSDYNVINIFEIEGLSPNKININRNGKPITIKDCVQYKQVGLYIDNYDDEAACAEAAKYIAFQILKCGYQDIDNVRILLEMNFNANNWITKFKQHPSFYEALILKTVRGVQTPGQPMVKMKEQYGFRTTGGQHGKNYYCELGATMIHKRQILVRQHHQDVNLSAINQLNQFGKNKKKNTYEGSCCHDDIAVTCLFVSIAQESRQFVMYLNEWLEKTIPTQKIYKIMEMLNIYVEQEAQLSDEMFHTFYKTASTGFGKLTHKQNGYGSIMSGAVDPNQYNNYKNGNIHLGFGNILSGRRF